MKKRLLKLKLPKNPMLTFRHDLKKTVWDKFYGWIRVQAGRPDDERLDVTRIYVSKLFNKNLEALLKLNIKKEYPGISGKRLELMIGMEMLNLSPSNAMDVPIGEVWVELSPLPPI